MELGTLREHGNNYDRKRPLVTEQTGTPRGPAALESYLPQSADDKAVKNNVSTLFEQIELHVENFYHDSTVSMYADADPELSKFDSPYLPRPLTTLFPQSRSRIPLIKHCLAQFIVSSISIPTNHERSFLPPDFVVLPNTIESCKSSKPKKPGFDEILARWRVLSAYLRPDPTEDPSYISRRDRAVSEAVQAFSRAFKPWRNSKYRDEDRVRSLTEIMKSAADLGIWLFSQPSTFKFHWGGREDTKEHTIVVAPALLKMADENAQSLSVAQVMIEMVTQKV
ncbi:MAG: hypothetical protein M1830_004320 [Pleopsidium flavum]|nr:MAG: hypothetical protein M1830_004320 [Pleopsidium flavum]